MHHIIRLFDLQERDYPRTHGTKFRTTQVFRCPYCNSITNKAEYVDVFWGAGPRVICPNAGECWHHELVAKLGLVHGAFPKSVADELEREIATLRADHPPARDIGGDPYLGETQPTHEVTVFSAPCKHYFPQTQQPLRPAAG